MVGAGIALLVLAGAAAIVAAILLARRRPSPVEPKRGVPEWTQAAGEDFTHLSDADRCDLVFAVAVLEDPRSQRLLEEALDDPSEAVALAAARAMATRGRTPELERYLARPGDRSRRIAATLELFT